MRFTINLVSFMRRTPDATKTAGPRAPTSAGLGRAVREAIDWNIQNRARRKRLGLE